MHNPTEDFLRSIDIHELLPQQEPFVIVGRVIHYDERCLMTETRIEEGNMFLEDGRLSSAGMIENIAQTCSARIGYINKYILGRDVQAGVIAGIKRLNVTGWPAVGDVITTKVVVAEDALGLQLIEAEVSDGRGRKVAEGDLVMRGGD